MPIGASGRQGVPSAGRVLTRRGLFAASAGLLVPAMVRAQDAPAPLVIGVLGDQTGTGQSMSGAPLVHAVRMAVQDTGLLPNGRSLSVVSDSFQRKPDDALTIARRWFDQGVSAIVDIPGSGAALAVQALARQRARTVLNTGSVAAELTGRACSPFGSAWTTDTASMATALARAMARSGNRTWFLVVPDTALGLTMQADATRAIEAVGGRVIAASRHPAEATEFASVAAQAKASGAQAVALLDINQALTGQLGQFRDAGLFGDGRQIVAFLSTITEIHAAGAKAGDGLLLASPFYWNQNEQSKSFANRFITIAGQMPDATHAAAYAAVRHYLRAVIATDGLDAGLVGQEMRRNPVYFFGRTGRLRLDGRLAVDLSLLRVKPPEAMDGAWDHYTQVGAISAADIYQPHNLTGCAIGL